MREAVLPMIKVMHDASAEWILNGGGDEAVVEELVLRAVEQLLIRDNTTAHHIAYTIEKLTSAYQVLEKPQQPEPWQLIQQAREVIEEVEYQLRYNDKSLSDNDIEELEELSYQIDDLKTY